MNWLDIFLGATIAISTAAGFARGFLRIGIGLAATVLAFVAASWLYADAGAWAIPYTSSRGVANLVGYLLVFTGILIAGSIAGRIAAKVFKWIGLSWLDRLGGAALGALRGGLIALIVVLAVAAFLPGSPPPALQGSRVAPHVLEAANVLAATTSPEMKRQFRQTYEKVKKAWIDPIRITL
jgi:membrane protein required for colicin V production